MKSFETCREQFYRRYIEYEATPEANNIDYLDGNVLQNLFEHWINYKFYKSQGEEWLLKAVPNYYYKHFHSRYRGCHLRDGDTHEKHLKVLMRMVPAVHGFFKPFIDRGAEIESEVELWYEYPRVRVQLNGKLDFLIRDGETLIIADLKAMQKGNKFIDKTQLIFYNLLLVNKGQSSADKNYFFTAKDSEIEEVIVTREDVAALETKLGDYTKIVRSYEFRELNVGNACYRCPFKTACWTEHGLLPTSNKMEF